MKYLALCLILLALLMVTFALGVCLAPITAPAVAKPAIESPKVVVRSESNPEPFFKITVVDTGKGYAVTIAAFDGDKVWSLFRDCKDKKSASEYLARKAKEIRGK